MQEWQAQSSSKSGKTSMHSMEIAGVNSFAEEDWHATQGDAYRRLSWMGVLSLTHLALNRTGMSLRAWQLLPQFNIYKLRLHSGKLT